MNNKKSLLTSMDEDSIRFSKSDKKLIETIKNDPNTVIHLSIAKLAKLAEVSEPTVNRFCHKLDCDGYPDFKLRLAQEITSTGRLFVDNMDKNDDSVVVIKKILSSIETSIKSLANSINPSIFNDAAQALSLIHI